MPASAEAFANGDLSYAKIRTLTRVATADNEVELVALAKTLSASDLGRAIAEWLQRNGDPEAIERYHHRRRLKEADGTWPTLAQQHADALAQLLLDGGGKPGYEVILHVRGNGTTMDDGTPIPSSVIERIASQAAIRTMIHDANTKPINVSGKHRLPTTRQKRLVKDRDRGCVDCGRRELLTFDHTPDFAESHRTVGEELETRCAPCHWKRHANQ